MSGSDTSAEPVDILLLGNVTRDLIDEHNPDLYRLGGTVTLASAPGRGTRVEIGLPWRPRPAGDLE